jgi:hypothetical protein
MRRTAPELAGYAAIKAQFAMSAGGDQLLECGECPPYRRASDAADEYSAAIPERMAIVAAMR